MKIKINRNKLIGVLLGIFICCGMNAYAQKIRIQGRVTNLHGRGIQDVDISDPFTKKHLDTTDEDGRYSVLMEKDDSLKYACIGYLEKIEKIRGRQEINVVLEDDVIELDEVTVISKVRNKVMPEPTDIEVKGNHFYIKTRIPVPKEMFTDNRRLVIQPSIYDITAGKRMLMRPVVFDGYSYNTTQNRMYDYDLRKDPLAEFIQVKTTSSRKDDVITYYDSLYIDNLQHSYRADVHLAMENYREIIYRDSFSIAQGTVNPLRFLEYDFSAFHLEDERFLPKPVMQLRDTKGEVNLTFLLGKAELDEKNKQNQEELGRLKAELHAIEANPEASLKNFHITGVASPDGGFQSNLRLAQLRTDNALERILEQLNADTRKYLDVKSDAEVASWNEVLLLLEQDSLQHIVHEMKTLMEKYEGVQLHRALKAKSFYKEIAANYLPRLRKVRYTYGYSIFRTLTDDEIIALYKQNPKDLTRFEYYRMIANAQNESEKERLCREALQLFDNFMYAANELAFLNIQKDTPDSHILEPFVSRNAPVEVLSNQTIALLSEGKYAKADSVMALIPEGKAYKPLLAVSQALAGYYEEAFDGIAATGPLNEVVMLLAMKKNQEAWNKLEKMKVSTAREYYVMAIAANRLEKVAEAIIYIEMALKLDPSLLEIAKIDSDIIDLLPEEQRIDN